MDKLPDDLLISIVSLLSVKERARTSVLAPRWRNFWKFIRILNFDDSEITDELRDWQLEERVQKRRIIMERFVKSVNIALISHSGETLDELRIESGLDINNAEDINRWIELAFRKRVQKLELNFKANTLDGKWNNFRFQTWDYLAYNFPNVERFDVSHHGRLSLVSLSVNQVNLSGEAIESIISNCPNLENLHIEMVNGLKSFGPSCQATRLRHLALISCNHLRKIEISAPNLVSYELVSAYYAYASTKLNGVSSLIHLSLAACAFHELVDQQLGDVSGCLSQLETLKLHTVVVKPWEMPFECDHLIGMEYDFPRLPKLMKLVLEIDKNVGGSILCFTPLIKSAPLLRELVLKLVGFGSGWSRTPERAQMELGQKHENLKVMEIQGYLGKAVDVEMVVYVMDYAASLDKVVIDGVAYTGEDLHLLKRNLLEKFDLEDASTSPHPHFLDGLS